MNDTLGVIVRRYIADYLRETTDPWEQAVLPHVDDLLGSSVDELIDALAHGNMFRERAAATLLYWYGPGLAFQPLREWDPGLNYILPILALWDKDGAL